MTLDTSELRRGLRKTRRYLLSHHEPADWDRCHQPMVFGRQLRICARCSGIYPGIIVGLLAGVLGKVPLSPVLILALFPLPALVDWSLSTFANRTGNNLVRTATGALLGSAYGLGLALISVGRILPVFAIGGVYGVSALGLLLAAANPGRIPGFK